MAGTLAGLSDDEVIDHLVDGHDYRLSPNDEANAERYALEALHDALHKRGDRHGRT